MRFYKIAALAITFALSGTTALAAAKTQVLSSIASDKYQLATVDEANRDQVACLALTLYHEARGSSEKDIMAVGMTVRNRMGTGTYCDAVWAPGQYSWTRWPLGRIPPRDKELSTWVRMMAYAQKVIDGAEDFTHGCTSFYATRLVTPRWAHRGSLRMVIGPHTYVRIEGL